MPNAEYCRRQSELCLHLAMATTERETINKFVKLAEDYRLRAEQLDGRDNESCGGGGLFAMALNAPARVNRAGLDAQAGLCRSACRGLPGVSAAPL
jgi:hypothetical protein